jgi:putative transposase
VNKWVSSAALAAAKLPGLPGTARGIRKHAARAGWAGRESDGLGGLQIEYEVTIALSDEQRGALERFEVGQNSPTSSEGVPEAPVEASPYLVLPATREYEDARRKLWREAEQLSRRARDFGARQAAALARALEAHPRRADARRAAAHELDLSIDRVAELLEKVARWRRDDWPAVLADRRNGRPRPQGYDRRIDELFRSDFLRMDRPPAMACWRRTLEIARVQEIPEPYPTCATLIRRLHREVAWQSIRYARYGEKALHRTFPAQVRDRTALRALECVVGDGYKPNLAVKWPSGEILRPVVWPWGDAYSNKILVWRVDASENWRLIQLAIADLIRLHGIPDCFYIDNTMAAASKWISGGSPSRHRFKVTERDPLGLINVLGSRVINALPRVGGSSKFIERAFGDFDRDISRHPAFDGAWLGTDPTTRPDAARKPVSLDKFLEVFGQGIVAHNARPGRRTAVCGSVLSFDEAFSESLARRQDIAKPTAEQWRMCLLAAERVRVSPKDGSIQLYGNRYWDQVVTAPLAGQCVVARYDPADLHSEIFIYSLNGKYIGAAACKLLSRLLRKWFD